MSVNLENDYYALYLLVNAFIIKMVKLNIYVFIVTYVNERFYIDAPTILSDVVFDVS